MDNNTSSNVKSYPIAGYSINFPYIPYSCQLLYMEKLLKTLKQSNYKIQSKKLAKLTLNKQIKNIELLNEEELYEYEESLKNNTVDSSSASSGLLESPTGTGKSLALLCATIAWQIEDKKLMSSRQEKLQSEWNNLMQFNNNKTMNPLMQDPAVLEFDPILDDLNDNNMEKKAIVMEVEEVNKLPAQCPTLQPTKIYFASRTHAQLTQLISALNSTSYRPRMSILASRNQLCINESVLSSDNKNDECKKLLEFNECRYFHQQGRLKTKMQTIPVFDIEDLVEKGKKVRGCPYFASRSISSDAELIFLPYNYIFDPNIRSSLGIQLSNAVVICIAEGTGINVSCGLAHPIEQITQPGSRIMSYRCVEDEEDCKPGLVQDKIKFGSTGSNNKGLKQVIQLTLSDGQELICTPDHRIRLADGRFEKASNLSFGFDERASEIEVAPCSIIDRFESNDWTLQVTGLPIFRMNTPSSRARTLAFARLIGAILGDGSTSFYGSSVQYLQGSYTVGHALDMREFRADIHLVLGDLYRDDWTTEPEIREIDGQDANGKTVITITYNVKLPAALVKGLASLDGWFIGNRSTQPADWPHVIFDDKTPVEFVREVLAAHMGADGTAPFLTSDKYQKQKREKAESKQSIDLEDEEESIIDTTSSINTTSNTIINLVSDSENELELSININKRSSSTISLESDSQSHIKSSKTSKEVSPSSSRRNSSSSSTTQSYTPLDGTFPSIQFSELEAKFTQQHDLQQMKQKNKELLRESKRAADNNRNNNNSNVIIQPAENNNIDWNEIDEENENEDEAPTEREIKQEKGVVWRLGRVKLGHNCLAIHSESILNLYLRIKAAFVRCGLPENSIIIENDHKVKQYATSFRIRQNSIRKRIQLQDTVAFAEKIGFRYAWSKQIRLSIAASYERMCNIIRDQRTEHVNLVCTKAKQATGSYYLKYGLNQVGKPKILAGKPVLHEYSYFMDASNHTQSINQQVIRYLSQHPEATVQNPPFTGARNFLNYIDLFTADFLNFQPARIINLVDFLIETGSIQAFSRRHALGRDDYSIPTMKLKVVARKMLNQQYNTYDLTCSKYHAFVANSYVVHNCDESHNVEDTAREVASKTLNLHAIKITVFELIRLKEIYSNAVENGMQDNNNIENKPFQKSNPKEKSKLIAFCELLAIMQPFLNFLNGINLDSVQNNSKSDQGKYILYNGAEIVNLFASFGLNQQNIIKMKRLVSEACINPGNVMGGLIHGRDIDKAREEPHLNGLAVTTLESIFMVLTLLFSRNLKYAGDYKLIIQRSNKPLESLPEQEKSINLEINFWCLNPAVAFDFLNTTCRSLILTSGTLSPMDSFSSELGISFPNRISTNHIINNNQIWLGLVNKFHNQTNDSLFSLNASYGSMNSSSMQDRYGESIIELIKYIPAGVLVFFPSYYSMDKTIEQWKKSNIFKRIQSYKRVLVEPKGSTTTKQVQKFLDIYHNANNLKSKKSSSGRNQISQTGAIFFGVCRGKLSEGIDFTDGDCRAVIVIGIPYPSVKDLQINLKRAHNDEMRSLPGHESMLSGSSWYSKQAYRCLNQAIGRAIRHQKDYGAIILLDERYSNSDQILFSQLSKWVKSAAEANNQTNPVTVQQAAINIKQFFIQHNSIENTQKQEEIESDELLDDITQHNSPIQTKINLSLNSTQPLKCDQEIEEIEDDSEPIQTNNNNNITNNLIEQDPTNATQACLTDLLTPPDNSIQMPPLEKPTPATDKTLPYSINSPNSSSINTHLTQNENTVNCAQCSERLFVLPENNSSMETESSNSSFFGTQTVYSINWHSIVSTSYKLIPYPLPINQIPFNISNSTHSFNFTYFDVADESCYLPLKCSDCGLFIGFRVLAQANQTNAVGKLYIPINAIKLSLRPNSSNTENNNISTSSLLSQSKKKRVRSLRDSNNVTNSVPLADISNLTNNSNQNPLQTDNAMPSIVNHTIARPKKSLRGQLSSVNSSVAQYNSDDDFEPVSSPPIHNSISNSTIPPFKSKQQLKQHNKRNSSNPRGLIQIELD